MAKHFFLLPQAKPVDTPYFLDETSPRFVYGGNWIHDYDSDVIWRGGEGLYSYHTNEVSVELTFTGSQFVVWTPATADINVTGADVRLYVDGVLQPGVTQRVANPDGSIPFNQSWAWYTSPVLPYGVHTFKMESDPASDGYIVFDGVQVRPLVADADTSPRGVDLVFRGTNRFGGDMTLFVDKVEVLDLAGNVFDAKLVNTTFEYPYLGGSGPYAYLYSNYDPKLGWTWGGGSGVATNGSGFNVPNTPNGSGVMFIQGATTSHQAMQLPPGVYQIRFLSAQRDNNQANTMEVYAGTTLIKPEFGPTQYVGFQPYLTGFFTVA